MLLNNFIATMYPKMNITDTVGTTIKDKRVFDDSFIGSISSDFYSDTGTVLMYTPFSRGIAFGSGTTPPPENRL